MFNYFKKNRKEELEKKLASERIQAFFYNIENLLKDNSHRLEEILEKLSKKVEEISAYILGSSGYSNQASFYMDDKEMKFDYRDGSVYRSDLMVPVLLVKSCSKTETKYTKETNLTEDEKKMFKEKGFVVIF